MWNSCPSISTTLAYWSSIRKLIKLGAKISKTENETGEKITRIITQRIKTQEKRLNHWHCVYLPPGLLLPEAEKEFPNYPHLLE